RLGRGRRSLGGCGAGRNCPSIRWLRGRHLWLFVDWLRHLRLGLGRLRHWLRLRLASGRGGAAVCGELFLKRQGGRSACSLQRGGLLVERGQQVRRTVGPRGSRQLLSDQDAQGEDSTEDDDACGEQRDQLPTVQREVVLLLH